MQDGLAAGGVGVELRQVMPQAPVRPEIDRGVKLPAGPGRFDRRVGNAVEENMIVAGQKQEVRRLFDQRKRGLKMIGQPGEGFRGGKRPPGEMRGGGGKLVHGIVLRALSAEGHLFGFGDVGGGINIHQVGGRAVRLVAAQAAVAVGPGRPILDVGQVQIGQGLAVIGPDARGRFLRPFAEQGGQLRPQIISPARGKLGEQRGRPFRAVILVRIVEVGAGHGSLIDGEMLVEIRQIGVHCRGGKGIQHRADPAGGRALDLLRRAGFPNPIETPCSGRAPSNPGGCR